jgi:hypothetical protein
MKDERKLVTVDDVIRRHGIEHIAPYYAWIRHVVTLATGTLTALVALQGHYVPAGRALMPSALATAWCALALAIGFGLLALLEENKSHLRAANHLLRLRRNKGEEAAVAYLHNGFAQPVPKVHRYSVILMSVCFGLGLLAAVTFSIGNLNW